MLRLILIVLVCITSWQLPVRSQEVMEAVSNAGVHATEVYGRIFNVSGRIIFVGRTGVWQMSGIETTWVQQYRPTSGTVIVTTSLGIAETVLLMDSKQNIWRLNLDGVVDFLQHISFSVDSYQICESSDGLMVVGSNKILGTIQSDLLGSSGQKEILTFAPPLRNVNIHSLEYNLHCKNFILTISGQDVSAPFETRYQRFSFVDSTWVQIEDSVHKQSSSIDQLGKTFVLSNNKLSLTLECPPAIQVEPVLSALKANALSRLTDSTFGLYQTYNAPNTGSPIYVFDSKGLRIVDSTIVAPAEVLFEVVSYEGLVLALCQDRILAYRDDRLEATIPWPSSKTPAIFNHAVGDHVTATMFGSGQLAPHVLTLSSGEWKPLFSIGVDTTQIVVVDGACQFKNITYMWEAENLYVSAGQDSMGQYFKLITAPRRVNHVRPISEGQALVLLEINYRDTVTPGWYSFSSSTALLTEYPDNWPRDVNVLPIVASTFDESTGTITAGTLTYWLDGRTDTSQYPIYGVLQRRAQESEWKMVNDELSLSLRCYSLKQSKHGVLYMLAGYSEGTLTYPRPSLYSSTDMGLNWIRSSTPLPFDLSKDVRLSVTDNGVFVHEKSCYRVLSNGEEFNRVEFSVGDIGEVFNLLDGLDSTKMIMATSTGVYTVTPSTTGVGTAGDVEDYASIAGNCVTVFSRTISGDFNIALFSSTGKTIHVEHIHVDQGSAFSFYLPSELSTGVYILVAGKQAFVLRNL